MSESVFQSRSSVYRRIFRTIRVLTWTLLGIVSVWTVSRDGMLWMWGILFLDAMWMLSDCPISVKIEDAHVRIRGDWEVIGEDDIAIPYETLRFAGARRDGCMQFAWGAAEDLKRLSLPLGPAEAEDCLECLENRLLRLQEEKKGFATTLFDRDGLRGLQARIERWDVPDMMFPVSSAGLFGSEMWSPAGPSTPAESSQQDRGEAVVLRREGEISVPAERWMLGQWDRVHGESERVEQAVLTWDSQLLYGKDGAAIGEWIPLRDGEAGIRTIDDQLVVVDCDGERDIHADESSGGRRVWRLRVYSNDGARGSRRELGWLDISQETVGRRTREARFHEPVPAAEDWMLRQWDRLRGENEPGEEAVLSADSQLLFGRDGAAIGEWIGLQDGEAGFRTIEDQVVVVDCGGEPVILADESSGGRRVRRLVISSNDGDSGSRRELGWFDISQGAVGPRTYVARFLEPVPAYLAFGLLLAVRRADLR